MEESSADSSASRPSAAVLTWLRLVRVFQQVDQLTVEHLRRWRLSVAQFDLLAQVGRSEGLTQQRLADALFVTKGNVCQLLDRMEADGLLRRCQVGRSKQLFLTDAGRRLFAEVVPAQEQLLNRLFAGISETDQRQLAQQLRNFHRSLRKTHSIGEQKMATETAQQTITWAIDKSHSSVEFGIKHMMFSTVKGRFSEFGGTITEHASDLSLSSVDVTIDTASIDTRDEKRDAHLRSADFFDVEANPTITFKSTKVRAISGARFAVIGDLTLHGVTRSVELDVEKTGSAKNPWGVEVAGFSATAQINRKDFGLNWNAALEAGGVLVGETVKISIELEAAKQA
jgi:polyisoprenoid-binding protein YceI/DNA-binding MarR family transcriptional regulator